MNDTMHEPFRVLADGTVHMVNHVPPTRKDEARVLAAPPMRAHNERRFAGLSAVPAGVNTEDTLPNYQKQVTE